MSSNVPINANTSNLTAPTPQNTPLTQAPIAHGLSRPTVPDINEDNESDEGPDADNDGGVDISGLQHEMLGMVHGKLAGLLGKSSGYIESLPIEVKLSVEALKGVQVKQNELQNLYKRECLELEKKYLNLAQPLYERRHAIITGTSAPTTEEIHAGEEYSLKEDEEYEPLPAPSSAPAATPIPEFWLTALRNHIALSELITDRDADALKHLVDVRLAYLDTPAPSTTTDAPSTAGKPGFKILFHFSPNEYFSNTLLEKTYLYQEEVGYSGDFVYDHAVGTVIQWKEDKDLTKEFEIKKQRNKNTNRTRIVRKSKPAESFFNFFSPPVPPTEEESEEMDEDDLEEIEEKLEMDYQIGEDLKEKIIPRAIDYFTGKALEYEVMDDEDDDFEDLDDDDEDGPDNFDSDSDDDDDDDDVPVRRRAGGGKRGGRGGAGGGAGGNVNPEECKQQ